MQRLLTLKPLKLLKYAWIVETALIIICWFVLLYWQPLRIPAFNSTLPFIMPLILAQGGAAFGGPVLKRKNGKVANENVD